MGLKSREQPTHAVHQYTSHMTGSISAMADNCLLLLSFLNGLKRVLAFLLGSFLTTLCIKRKLPLDRLYAL